MSWDVDEVEFYETFAEIAADPNRGLDGAKEWAWSALHWTQQELRERDEENRKLRSVLEWVNAQCPGKCAAMCDEALRAKPSPSWKNSSCCVVSTKSKPGSLVWVRNVKHASWRNLKKPDANSNRSERTSLPPLSSKGAGSPPVPRIVLYRE